MKGRESEEREFPKALHEIDFSCAKTKGLLKAKNPQTNPNSPNQTKNP